MVFPGIIVYYARRAFAPQLFPFLLCISFARARFVFVARAMMVRRNFFSSLGRSRTASLRLRTSAWGQFATGQLAWKVAVNKNIQSHGYCNTGVVAHAPCNGSYYFNCCKSNVRQSKEKSAISHTWLPVTSVISLWIAVMIGFHFTSSKYFYACNEKYRRKRRYTPMYDVCSTLTEGLFLGWIYGLLYVSRAFGINPPGSCVFCLALVI